MSVVGVLVVVAIAVCARWWFATLPWLLGLSLALPTTAAIQVAGQNLSAFAVVSLVAAPTIAWRWTRPGSERPFQFPGATALLVLLGWSVMVTAAGPLLFAGVEVLSPRGGINFEVIDPSVLTHSVSNVAQIAYLTLGVLVIGFLAWERGVSRHCLTPGLLLCMLLSNWRLAADRAGVPYPVDLIDNSTSVKYVNQTATGELRLRGVFSEPSGLGLYGVAAVVLALVMLPLVRGAWRWAYLALALSAAVNVAFAQSGTALVGGTVMVGLLAAAAVYLAVARGAAVMPVAVALCLGVATALVLQETITTFFTGSIDDKVDSSSFAIRSTADVFSWRLGFDTFGIGVGLGSNRPSSLWPMLWSCTGVVGTLAFLLFIIRIVRSGISDPSWAPWAWVVLSLVVCKSVAGSDLSIPLLIVAAGLSARAGGRHVRPEVPPPPPRRADGTGLQALPRDRV